MNKSIILVIVLVILLAGGGVWYYITVKNQAQSVDNQILNNPANTESQNQNANLDKNQNNQDTTSTQNNQQIAKEFTVRASNFKFSPNQITVNKDDVVRITLINDSNSPHALKIDAFNIATKTLNTGESATIQFTANQKGNFNFYCPVDGHRDLGMTGSLMVQ